MATSAYVNVVTQREAARTTVAVIGAGFLGKYVCPTLSCTCLFVLYQKPLRKSYEPHTLLSPLTLSYVNFGLQMHRD